MIVVFAVLAGGLGAGSRFAADGEIKSRLGDRFPRATLSINVAGSLLLGIITGLVIHRGAPNDLKVVLGTGFCGGFTTFGTATFETLRLLQRGASLVAVLYALATVVASVGFAAIGLAATA